MQAMLQVLVALSGCAPDRGDKPVIPIDPMYLESPDQVLPAGIVGKPYEASLFVSGGEPPYTWLVVEGETVPQGLVVSLDGRVTGIPAEAGSFAFTLLANDSAGRAKRSRVSLDVVLQPEVLQCGDTFSGRFRGNGFGPGGPDLGAHDSLAWLAVELPNELVNRVELAFTSDAVSTLYVERATETPGSSLISDHYVPVYLNPGYTDMNVAIDAGTSPSLTGYLPQGQIPMLLVGQTSGDWSVEVVCTDGPVFVQLDQYPIELGQPLTWDYQVYGDETDVRIWTDDPLPAWMIWDETTGTISGTAEETGAWEFTLVAETSDGRRREERAILGVYDVTTVACGETVPLSVTESYFDGEFYAFYDTRGFDVFRIPLEGVEASRITLEASGSDGHYLGLSNPTPELLNFYGGAERLYVNEPTVSIDVDPGTYPSIGHFYEAGEIYFSAGTIGLDTSLDVTVICDTSPRPDLAALPVIQPLAAVSHPLSAIGGSPPYRWSATDLPSGIDLDTDGVLSGQTGAVGTWPVSITVTDRTGASTTGDWTLYVGNDEACAGYRPIVCGDSIDGTFTDTYYNDRNGDRSTEVFCIVDTTDENLGFEIFSDDGELRIDVADPAATADELFDLGLGTYVAWVQRESSEGLPLDPWSWPDIDDFANLPILVAVRAYEPGDWTVHLVCL